MNEWLLEQNEEFFKKLNIYNWHNEGIIGKGINVAVIGYGAIMADKKPYVVLVNKADDGGSYHDGDELIHEVAPGSKIYSINIFKRGWSFEEALKWILENNIDVVCTSIAMDYWDTEREELSRQLYQKGVIMVDSSDNEGKEDSIGYPAKSPYWYAVGALSGDKKAGYSSYGKDLDIMGYTDFGVHAKEDYVIPISHTSGTTQVISGMVALLKQAYKIDNKGFKEYMKNNSLDLGPAGWDKETGWGLFKLEEKPSVKLPVMEESKENKEGENMKEKDYFKDDNGQWHEKYNNRLASLGIVNGYEDGTIKADNNISRGEVNKIACALLDTVAEMIAAAK